MTLFCIGGKSVTLIACKVWVPPVRNPGEKLASGTSVSIGNRVKSNGVGRSEAGCLVPLESSIL